MPCGYVNIWSVAYAARHKRVGYIGISAWASALLVQTVWAMPEPQGVGRATSTVPTLEPVCII